jgi:hypothetical protein
METSSPPQPAIDLSAHLYYQLVYTLTDLLPPPLDDTLEALHVRNHAAIAKVAALLPVNANEIDLAAQCIAARAQAEEMLRLLRQHAGDIALVMRLNAQYGSMVRTSLSVLGRLMRVQTLRQKREAIDGAASEDAWALHVAERTMLKVVDPDAKPPQAAGVDQRIVGNVPENEASPQDMAFETWSSAQPWNQGSGGLDETHLQKMVRATMANSRLGRRELPANGRGSPARATMSAEVPDGPQSKPRSFTASGEARAYRSFTASGDDRAGTDRM